MKYYEIVEVTLATLQYMLLQIDTLQITFIIHYVWLRSFQKYQVFKSTSTKQ